jgi:DNA-nicking Smr family endonuclease
VTPEAPETEKKPVEESGLAPRRPTRSAAPPKESVAPLAAGKATGMDARTLTRLRRGQTRIEARIDLHGMTQAEAYAALTEFVVDARNEGRRTLLVITGRGTRAGPGGGVLRTQLPGWLNGPVLRPHVLAFAPAQPKHGGAGAFYVYLRKGTVR